MAKIGSTHEWEWLEQSLNYHRCPKCGCLFHGSESNEKTQPQLLLEEVIGAEGQRADFPSIEAQQEYWQKKDDEYEAYLNAQHEAQRRDTEARKNEGR